MEDKRGVRFQVNLILGVLVNSFTVYSSWTSDYFYYGFGNTAGALIGLIIVAIQFWGKIEIIKPLPARMRYYGVDNYGVDY